MIRSVIIGDSYNLAYSSKVGHILFVPNGHTLLSRSHLFTKASINQPSISVFIKEKTLETVTSN